MECECPWAAPACWNKHHWQVYTHFSLGGGALAWLCPQLPTPWWAVPRALLMCGTSVASVLRWAQMPSAAGWPSAWGGVMRLSFLLKWNSETGCQISVTRWPVCYRSSTVVSLLPSTRPAPRGAMMCLVNSQGEGTLRKVSPWTHIIHGWASRVWELCKTLSMAGTCVNFSVARIQYF